jgi:TatD DNase family protein
VTAVTAAPLLDTHCHLDAYDNPILVLDQARAAGVHVVAVTEDPGRYRLLRTRLGRRAGVEVALGLHPLRVAGASMAEVARFRRLLREAIWVGEVGLDFSRAGAATRSQQLRTFDALLAEVRAGSWPVSVHSRGAERETVDRLVDARVRAILHWYTGPLAVAEDALAGGLWFSINPAMAASMRSRALLAHLPPGRVVLETDGPFARRGGRPTRPADLVSLVQRLADLWAVSVEEARATIVDNQLRMLAQPYPARSPEGFASRPHRPG